MSHSAENFRGHALNVPENLGYRKILCILGGITFFPRKFFCLTVPKNFVGESFSVSLTSGPEKIWIKEGGVYQDFPSKIFCLSAEKFRRGIFWCFTNFWSRKILDKRRGSITIFRRSFCLTVLNYFIGEHFGASEKFFHRKFSCIGGGHHGFVGTFCLTGPKRKAL